MGIETQINTLKCGKGFLCGLNYCPHSFGVWALITPAFVICFQQDDRLIFLDSFLWFKLLPSHSLGVGINCFCTCQLFPTG
jgi:hypothetical protein